MPARYPVTPQTRPAHRCGDDAAPAGERRASRKRQADKAGRTTAASSLAAGLFACSSRPGQPRPAGDGQRRSGRLRNARPPSLAAWPARARRGGRPTRRTQTTAATMGAPTRGGRPHARRNARHRHDSRLPIARIRPERRLSRGRSSVSWHTVRTPLTRGPTASMLVSGCGTATSALSKCKITVAG
jgi:hypothetical protein